MHCTHDWIPFSFKEMFLRSICRSRSSDSGINVTVMLYLHLICHEMNASALRLTVRVTLSIFGRLCFFLSFLLALHIHLFWFKTDLSFLQEILLNKCQSFSLELPIYFVVIALIFMHSSIILQQSLWFGSSALTLQRTCQSITLDNSARIQPKLWQWWNMSTCLHTKPQFVKWTQTKDPSKHEWAYITILSKENVILVYSLCSQRSRSQ